ncbi:hypothetical protein AB0C34_14895 [Nocardia sp. NPDC049220]|uniref:hypothetical protein n=1 Tax=Nocardia sp. NPDC049220 TaxID=3155273 RepID=UPI00340B0901
MTSDLVTPKFAEPTSSLFRLPSRFTEMSSEITVPAEQALGIAVLAVAQRLTTEAIPYPSVYDRNRNKHRSVVAWP